MIAQAGEPPQRRRVLIVDDDPDFAASLADILAVHGYSIATAEQPAAAIDALRREAIPVALLDIRLGVSSGVDLLRRLTADDPHLICVVMTAHVETETAIRALRNGAYDYVDKSCEPHEFLAVLDRCFEKVELRREKEAADEALRTAKEEAEAASRAKSDFLANMSHELRTPLNAVIGFSELMLSEVFGPLGNERYRHYAKDIRDSGSHLLRIIDDILDLSKAEAGKLALDEEVLDVREVIEATSRLVRGRAETAALDVATSIPAGLPRLRADGQKLKQILLNLLSNAVKFTPPGGCIEIRASADAQAGFTIAVRDTGIGIAKEHIPKILQPFGQVESSLSRRYQGTGLGLPLARKMMQLHGGELAIESEPWRGTAVAIIFPAERIVARPVTA